MAGFSFPPPPPPPPKATAHDASSATNQAQPGTYGQRPGRGGGDRGRGRGRGRGNQNRGGFARGATNHNASMNQSLPHNSFPPQRQHVPAQQNMPSNNPSLNMAALPAGGYINPAFAQMYANAMNHAPAMPRPWLTQAPSSQSTGYPTSTKTTASLPRLPASQRSSNKPKVQAAPSVPSFGFALPTLKAQRPRPENHEESKSKKRKHNQLGLTPRGEMHEDSEEDDADEEAKFISSVGAIQFEYKGQSSTLKTPDEIAAWIEERKKRYPTKERIAQKQKEAEERKRAKEQADAEMRVKEMPEGIQMKKRKRKDGDAQEKAMKKAEKLREKLRQAEEAVARAKAKKESHKMAEAVPRKSLGINYESEESAKLSADEGTSSLAESSSEVSTDSDSEDSSSSDDDSDDGPPEEESSSKRPLKVHLPNRKAPPAKPTQPRRGKPNEGYKRMTLHERWVEQERQQEAELVLRAIKYLGQNGVLA